MKRKELKVIEKTSENECNAMSNSINTRKFREVVSNIKLSFDGSPLFFVNKEKGTIACRIRSFINVPTEINQLSNYFLYKHNLDDRPSYFDTVGVVHLHEGEKWNEKLGKMLAEGKAKKLAYTKALNYANDIIYDVISDLRAVVSFRNNMSTLRTHEIEHFDELVNQI